ncbi:uncharacterized protein LOC117344099 [Pecten maximus]|uniref:uncharacterized protein LOC117344099 n=1 Tax=Pecten maximus TaxID=6579 RepID=UPI0014588914|nr:uncharacterized protein LOC117344099 [Pecten maximus]
MFVNRAIRLDVALIIPGEGSTILLQNTGVDVNTVEGQGSYYFYLCQTEEAYSNPPALEPGEEAFGHILECQTWGSRVKTTTLTVTVERPLRSNEEVVLRPETKLGGVDQAEVQDVGGKEVCLRKKNKSFQLSNEAVTLKPDVEPEAEIAIPAGTFESGELSIKFVDTAEVNEEIKESEESENASDGPMLMTNVLDLSTTDGQQPTKDIEMRIPVKTKDKTEEFLVLTSSNPDPNLEEWVWEKLEAEIDDAGKAVFNINHFSIYAGAAKKTVLKDEKTVEAAIRQSYLKMRKIHFLVMVNKPQPNATKTDITIMCGTQRKTKTDKKKMYKRSCECFDSGTDLFEVPEGQIFQIRLGDGLKETSGNEHLTLIFKSSDSVSKRTFEVTGFDPSLHELNGSVEILAVTRHYPIVEVEKEVGIFCKKMKTVQVKSKEYTEKMATMVTVPISVRLVKKEANEDDDPSTMDELDMKDKCIIPALRWKNLRETMKELSEEEALQLGAQLGIKPDVLDEIREKSSESDIGFNIIFKWRLKLPGNHQAMQLQNAFVGIGKTQIAGRMSNQGLEEQQHDTSGEMSTSED